MANLQEEFNEDIENYQINEDYKVWKKNAPHLYDLALTHVFDWPSLTCQWLPLKDSPQDADYSIHKLVLGTHTSDQEPNFLMIAKVRLPNNESLADTTEYSVNTKDTGAPGNITGEHRVDIETKILHEGEVNRARYMPQKYNVIATKTTSGEVHVFDYSQHPATPVSLDHVKPEVRLVGHTCEGYGLNWSKHKLGHILSGSNDHKICLWNVEGSNTASSKISPLHEFKFHTAGVQDVTWHHFSPEIFASVGNDKRIVIWDMRKPQKPCHDIQAHAAEINSIDFNPSDEYLFVTGSSDHTCAFWDLRNTSKSLHRFEGHTDEVMKVEWEPNHASLFASSGNDRRIRVWDINKIGQQVKNDIPLEGAPELMFLHSGHRAPITDFSWNVNEPVLMASAEEENNVLQIWQMASSIYREDSKDGMMEIRMTK